MIAFKKCEKRRGDALVKAKDASKTKTYASAHLYITLIFYKTYIFHVWDGKISMGLQNYMKNHC